MTPKILIACPIIDTRKYALDQYLTAFTALTYPNKELLLVDNSATEDFYHELKKRGLNVIRGKHFEKGLDALVFNRNVIRTYFLSRDYDYLLSLDSDVIPEPDALERLMRHNKDIVSGVYYSAYLENGTVVAKPMLYKRPTPQELEQLHTDTHFKQMASQENIQQEMVFRQLLKTDIQQLELLDIDVAGLGVVLIKRCVLEKVSFRHDPVINGSEDYFFFTDAKNAGFKAYADTSVKCSHLHAARTDLWKK